MEIIDNEQRAVQLGDFKLAKRIASQYATEGSGLDPVFSTESTSLRGRKRKALLSNLSGADQRTAPPPSPQARRRTTRRPPPNLPRNLPSATRNKLTRPQTRPPRTLRSHPRSNSPLPRKRRPCSARNQRLRTDYCYCYLFIDYCYLCSPSSQLAIGQAIFNRTKSNPIAVWCWLTHAATRGLN